LRSPLLVAVSDRAWALRVPLKVLPAIPESSGKVTVTMLIGLAMIESLCIYALVVSLILIYAHPQAAAIAGLFAS
jgi:F-type H+-transporting ATPase subunit c